MLRCENRDSRRGGHEAKPRVSRATLVVPTRMDHRDRMRASRCIDPLRCRPLDDVGRGVGRELVLRDWRAAAGRRFDHGNHGRLPPGGSRRGAADQREEGQRHRVPAMRHLQRTGCRGVLCVLPSAGLDAGCDPMNLNADYRRASTPSDRPPRAELLHVLMLPDFERADRVRSRCTHPSGRASALERAGGSC